MCGRYVTASSAARLAAEFGAADHTGGTEVVSFNRAPTQPTPAVLIDRDGRRVLTTLRWGMVPSWAPDPRRASRLINARVETVLDRPAFRTAVRQRRTLLPASGWFEWPARYGKSPVYITGDAPFAFAGIHDRWLGPDGTLLRTCSILTTAATPAIAPLHHRMPVLVAEDRWQAWLTAPDDDVPALLADLATPPQRLDYWPVDRAVGSVHADTPQLLTPVSLAGHMTSPRDTMPSAAPAG